ncbi:MAG: aspartate kinase, partial [Bacteroidales bacterium]|nr:aspartate kinase [Bacteroidales bacterium]
MKVLKFGGTSVGTSDRLKALIDLVVNNEPKLVVLSAMAGTTDSLIDITEFLYQNKKKDATDLSDKLQKKYYKVINELYASEEWKKKATEMVDSHFAYIKGFTIKVFTKLQEKAILAQGELISTALFHYLLNEQNIDSALIPVLNFMRIDKDGEPDYFYISENLNRELEKVKGTELIITQGYICRNAYGEIDNLKRGGSDYTASIIGSIIQSEEVQIWTDINGFRNNDPRYIDNTVVIRELSFDEAAELAYFGAKILHPTSILPCKDKNIPVRLKNTIEPDDPGTLITDKYSEQGIKAIAVKDGITAIKIKSTRMLLAYGFLRRVFEVFEIYKTSIDMITTSEVAVSITIDDPTYLNEIEKELRKFGIVEIEKGQSIICIVGDFLAERKG